MIVQNSAVLPRSLFSGGSIKSATPTAIDFLICSGLFLAILFVRWPLIHITLPLNPDEAQAAANALRLEHDWVTWRAVDGSSNGPLNFFILLWPKLFGLPITLQSTRLTSAILTGGIIASGYLIGRRFMSQFFALLAVAVTLVFEVSTHNLEFIHYSSEYLSSFLIFFSVWLFFLGTDNEDATWTFVLAAFLLGSVPYAKLQAVPPALVLGLSIVAWQFFRSGSLSRRFVYSSIVGSAALAMSGFILIPLLLAGEFDSFWRGYIVGVFNMLVVVKKFWDYLPFITSNRPVWVIAKTSAVLLGYATFIFWLFKPNLTASHRLFIAIAVAIFLACCMAVVAPGRLFPHYLTFLIIGMLLLSVASLLIPSRVEISDYRSFILCRVAPSIIVGVGGYYTVVRAQNEPWGFIAKTRSPAIYSDEIASRPDFLRPVAEDGDRLYVWGWMSQWYVFSGLTPAGRETTSYNEMHPDAYFRDRMLRDIAVVPPAVIIDAVAPKSFGFSDSKKESLEIFPEFSSFVREKFALVNGPAAQAYQCPKIYVRSKRLNAIGARFITPSNVRASAFAKTAQSAFSPDRAFDASMFEQCGDYWLLPKSTYGWIEAEYAEAPISALWLLNTLAGDGSGRSRRVRVECFLKNALVYTQSIAVKSWPTWSVLPLAKPIMTDKVRISIEAFEGDAGGLNEIKIVRAESTR